MRILIENETITVSKNSKKIDFKKRDIKHFYLVKVEDGTKYMTSFKYFIVILKTGDFVYATSLI